MQVLLRFVVRVVGAVPRPPPPGLRDFSQDKSLPVMSAVGGGAAAFL